MGRAYERVAALTLHHGAKPIARLPQYASMKYGTSQIDTFRKAIGDLAAIAGRNGWLP